MIAPNKSEGEQRQILISVEKANFLTPQKVWDQPHSSGYIHSFGASLIVDTFIFACIIRYIPKYAVNTYAVNTLALN